MGQQENYAQLDATLHAHPKDHMQIRKLTGGEIKVSLILRRKDKSMLKDMEYFHSTAFAERTHFTRKDFETNLGASPDDIARVQAFAKEAGLKLLKSNASSRSALPGPNAISLPATILKRGRMEALVFSAFGISG